MVVAKNAQCPTPGGRLIAVSGSSDGTVRVWDPLTDTPLAAPLTGHTREVNSVARGINQRGVVMAQPAIAPW